MARRNDEMRGNDESRLLGENMDLRDDYQGIAIAMQDITHAHFLIERTIVLRTFRAMRITLTILILAQIGSLLFGLQQHRKTNRWQGVKVDFTYDLARDITISRLKSDGRLLDVGYDRNQDLENDSLVAYAANGRVCQIWVDEDFNGLYEVNYMLDTFAVITVRFEDIGQDGYFEELTRFRSDSVFVYRDADMNGWYDDHEMIRREYRRSSGNELVR
jgi:hypothetical protein